MKRPWMPLYVADYLHDTAHLRAADSGAYLHLIMAYWVKGSLPNDNRQLATIAKMTDAEWKKARPLIEPFFAPGFTGHKRIDAELAKTVEISNKRRAAAEQRHSKTHANADAFAPANGPTPHTSHSTKVGGGDDATALAIVVSRIAGFENAPDDWTAKWHGAPMRVQTWLNQGYQTEIILSAVRGVMSNKLDGPPDGPRYFEKAIARAHAEAAAPLPTMKIIPASEITHVQQPHRPRVGEGIDRLRARLRSEDDGTGDEGTRPEPDRGVVEILPPRKAGG